MDQKLKATIHRYSENREIDYMSAKNLGNSYGVNFKNEQELVEFKQCIDSYLKTFSEEKFSEIEALIEGYTVSSFANPQTDLMYKQFDTKMKKAKEDEKKKKK